jgi:isopenicillin N synthase-like dioxygenase
MTTHMSRSADAKRRPGATAIPRLDIAPLFGPAGAARAACDAAIVEAASQQGFMTVCGLGDAVPHGRAARAELLRIFALPTAAKVRLLRRKFDASHANIYRGWFPLQPGAPTFKEGLDVGSDLVRAIASCDDPLLEPTPLPGEDELPGWRDAAARYYRAMEHLGLAMMRAIARGLGLPEATFDLAFVNGVSTLRFIRYPARTRAELAAIQGATLADDPQGRHFTGGAHVDSGLITLLAQDGVAGLQARALDGSWIDVPPDEGTLAVNFGKLLERWTGGRIRATEHRVVGHGAERCSIPFFFEPAIDAVIAPLPLAGIAPFQPFAYGDHVWAAMCRFLEFRGIESLRKPTGARPRRLDGDPT